MHGSLPPKQSSRGSHEPDRKPGSGAWRWRIDDKRLALPSPGRSARRGARDGVALTEESSGGDRGAAGI